MGRGSVLTGIRSGYFSAPMAASGRGGQPAKLRRTCSYCGTAPGHKCRRWISERIQSHSTTFDAGGRWHYLKTMHRER